MALPAIDEDENAMWGRPPGLQADALVGLVGVTAEFEQRDQGVPRRPGGLPHNGGVIFRGADPIRNVVRSLTVAALSSVLHPGLRRDLWSQRRRHSITYKRLTIERRHARFDIRTCTT